VFTGHGQNDAGGHFHHETNERYLLQKLRLFRVTAFFIADVGNGLILSCSSEFESSVCSQGYRFFRECLRSRGKVRHLRGLGGGIRSLFRAELALRRQTVVEDFEPKLREWLNPI
jgi:hypothetical protein